jgi:copper chaperone CopZ
MTVTIYRVPDISCEHCKRAIEGEVSEVPGVTSAVVTIDAKLVRVEGHAPDEAIRAAIENAGYDIAETTPT